MCGGVHWEKEPNLGVFWLCHIYIYVKKSKKLKFSKVGANVLRSLVLHHFLQTYGAVTFVSFTLSYEFVWCQLAVHTSQRDMIILIFECPITYGETSLV